MKYAGPFHGKGLVFLAMAVIAAYIAYKATEPIPGPAQARSSNHSTRYR